MLRQDGDDALRQDKEEVGMLKDDVITLKEDSSVLEQGLSTLRRDSSSSSSASEEDSSILEQGLSTLRRGSASEQDGSTLRRGNNALEQGVSTLKREVEVIKQALSVAIRGQRDSGVKREELDRRGMFLVSKEKEVSCSYSGAIKNLTLACKLDNVGLLQDALEGVNKKFKHMFDINRPVDPKYFGVKKPCVPLVFACFSNKVRVVEALLQVSGIKVDVMSEDFEAPLLCAVLQQNVAIVKLLLQAGASVTLASRDGKTTPLQAGISKSMEIFTMLTECHKYNSKVVNFDPNIVFGELNRSLLHEAVKNLRYEHVAYLIKLGANWSLPDVHGVTPLMMAEGDKKMLEVLRGVPNEDLHDVDENISEVQEAVKQIGICSTFEM